MLRISLIALLLSPGIAHAQKFLSVGDEEVIPVSVSTGETGIEAALDDAGNPSIVVNATTDLELPDVGTAGLEGGIDDNGDLTLDLDGPFEGDMDTVADLELGECNPGTTWDAELALCWNGYPHEAVE